MSVPWLLDSIIDARDTEILALVDSFERCTVPRGEWNHRAHMVYALVMLLRHGPVAGAREIRAGIMRYNRVQGIEQTLSSGYHETLTRFFITVVESFIATCDLSSPLHDLAEELWDRFGDRDLPYTYYSRELLSSWEARTSWIAPDLKPL